MDAVAREVLAAASARARALAGDEDELRRLLRPGVEGRWLLLAGPAGPRLD
jgi:hypothetical protein